MVTVLLVRDTILALVDVEPGYVVVVVVIGVSVSAAGDGDDAFTDSFFERV